MNIIEDETNSREELPNTARKYIEQKIAEGFVVIGVYRADTQKVEYDARLIALQKEHDPESGIYEIVEDSDKLGQYNAETGQPHPMYYKILEKRNDMRV